MSILETVMVYVGIPAAVFAVVAGLVYMSSARPSRRYRPGRPYEFTPVWFVSNPSGDVGDGRAAIEAASGDADGPANDGADALDGSQGVSSFAVKGGARGSW
jgi:hypothetical protein